MPRDTLATLTPISVHIDGQKHTGQIEIRGRRQHVFIVHYAGRKSSDGRKYGKSSEERNSMMVMAETTLKQLINVTQCNN